MPAIVSPITHTDIRFWSGPRRATRAATSEQRRTEVEAAELAAKAQRAMLGAQFLREHATVGVQLAQALLDAPDGQGKRRSGCRRA